MVGQIVKIISNDYFISYNNKEYLCKARGKFKNDNIIPKVGDYVIFNKDDKVIEKILPRKNELDRPFVSNIDRAFIVTSLKSPDFSTNLLDKLLVICNLNDIEPIICLTKKDLLTNTEFKDLKKIIKYYRSIGYKVVFNTNLFRIKRMFKGRTTVFTGQTGSGKSTLINKLSKDLNFETGEISKSLGRGKHTTRTVTLVDVCGGKVLDTPGFSAIDLKGYSELDIKSSFVEFKYFDCPYKDCNHIGERDCKVKMEVGKSILKSRYDNYIKFIEKR